MSSHHGPIRVVLATDSFLLGDGLASLLADVDDVEVVGRACDHEELAASVEDLQPEAVIISIRTPVVTTMTTIEAARKLRVNHPELGIVVISDRGNGFALELLRGGASRIAYLLDERLPSMDTVLGALREIRQGQSVLDPASSTRWCGVAKASPSTTSPCGRPTCSSRSPTAAPIGALPPSSTSRSKRSRNTSPPSSASST